MTEAQKLTLFCVAVVSVIVSLFFAIPLWNVWRSGLSGEAALARAEQTKRIMIATAAAEQESAQLRADAIAILGSVAQQFPEYRRQEFIQAFGEALREGNIHQIVYVPTEAMLPITEARGER